MFKKMTEQFGFIGDSFDQLVEQELQAPLAQLYFKLRPSPLNTKNTFLDTMDKYIQLSQDKEAIKTQEFNEFETTLLLDIFRVIYRRPYTEGDTLTFSKQALQDYTSLSDEKRSLFRQSVTAIPHKTKSFSFKKTNARV